MLNQQDVFQLFGHISVFYSTWETMVTIFIIKVVNEKYKGETLIPRKNITLGNKLALINRLTDEEVNSVETMNFIRKILPEAIVISGERNRYIHDNWLFSSADLAMGRISRIPCYIGDQWGYSCDPPVYYTIVQLEELLAKLSEMQDKFSKAIELLEV